MDARSCIEAIIDLEWPMFHSVNGEDGPKADCQNDKITFEAMRFAQFAAWDQPSRLSYLEDLQAAKAAGRNLCTEKYIHMMKSTAILQYRQLEHLLTFPDAEGMELVDQITEKLIEQTEVLFQKFPYTSGFGRPLRSSMDLGGVTSVETYQRGELMTYSTKTLSLLWQHLLNLEQQGRALARVILENSIRSYGFPDLETAEAEAKLRVEAMPIEVSFGCSCCSDDRCGDDGCGDDGCDPCHG